MLSVEQRPANIVQNLQRAKDRLISNLRSKDANDAFYKAYIASVEGTVVGPMAAIFFNNIEVFLGALSVATVEVARNGYTIAREALRRKT